MTSPSIAALTANPSFGQKLLDDLSALFQASFHVADFSSFAQCGSVSPYTTNPARRLLSVQHTFHALQTAAYSSTVKLYLVGTGNATRWATALASDITAFGFTGAESGAVVPSGQTVTVTIPCDQSHSVAIGSSCSALVGSSVPSSDSSDSTLSAGALAGVVIGAVVGSFLICCLLVAAMKESAKREDEMLEARAQRRAPPAHLQVSAPTHVDDHFILYHTPTPPVQPALSESPSSAAELYDEVMTPHHVREEEPHRAPPTAVAELSRRGHISISAHGRPVSALHPTSASRAAAAAEEELHEEELSAIGRHQPPALPEPLHVA